MSKNTINIHGKEYETVASRVQRFREKYAAYSIETVIVDRTADEVVMRALISDESGRVIATGFAEEQRQASSINRTSALENCETSAIGRALAAFGMAGTEYASADEVASAISQQSAPKAGSKATDTRPAVGTAKALGDRTATPTQKARIKAYLTSMAVLPNEMPTWLEGNFGIVPGSVMTSKDAENILKELQP